MPALRSSLDPELLIPRVEVRPPRTIEDRLTESLKSLRGLAGFRSGVVSRRDGLVISHTLDNMSDAARLCAMAAALTGTSWSTGVELNQGAFNHATVRYMDGILLIKEAGPLAILAALFAPGMDATSSMTKLHEVGETISDILEDLR